MKTLILFFLLSSMLSCKTRFVEESQVKSSSTKIVPVGSRDKRVGINIKKEPYNNMDALNKVQFRCKIFNNSNPSSPEVLADRTQTFIDGFAEIELAAAGLRIKASVSRLDNTIVKDNFGKNYRIAAEIFDPSHNEWVPVSEYEDHDKGVTYKEAGKDEEQTKRMNEYLSKKQLFFDSLKGNYIIMGLGQIWSTESIKTEFSCGRF